MTANISSTSKHFGSPSSTPSDLLSIPPSSCFSFPNFDSSRTSLLIEFLTELEQQPATFNLQLSQQVGDVFTQILSLTYLVDFQKERKELNPLHPHEISFAFCVTQWRTAIKRVSKIQNDKQIEKTSLSQIKSNLAVELRNLGKKTRDLNLAWKLLTNSCWDGDRTKVTQEIVNWYESELSDNQVCQIKGNQNCCGWEDLESECGSLHNESDEENPHSRNDGPVQPFPSLRLQVENEIEIPCIRADMKNSQCDECQSVGTSENEQVIAKKQEKYFRAEFFQFLWEFQKNKKKLNEFPSSWNTWIEMHQQIFNLLKTRGKLRDWLNGKKPHFVQHFSSFQWNLKLYLLLWISLQKKKQTQGKFQFMSNHNLAPFLNFRTQKLLLDYLSLLLRVRSIEHWNGFYQPNRLNPLTLSIWIKHWNEVAWNSACQPQKTLSFNNDKNRTVFIKILSQLTEMERKTVIRLYFSFVQETKSGQTSENILTPSSFEFLPFLFSLSQLQNVAKIKLPDQWIRTKKAALKVLRRFVGIRIFDFLDLSQSVITGSALLPACSSQLLAENKIKEIPKSFRSWVEEELYYPKAYTHFPFPKSKVKKMETEGPTQTSTRQKLKKTEQQQENLNRVRSHGKRVFSLKKAHAIANLEKILAGNHVRWVQNGADLVVSSDAAVIPIVTTPNLNNNGNSNKRGVAEISASEIKKRQQIECQLTPGSDVDILVWNDENFQSIAENHIRTIQSLCPQYQVKIERIDKSGALQRETDPKTDTKTEIETTENIKRYLLYDPEFHFRPIQIYCAPLHSIFSHHCAPVRAFCARNGKEREIFLTSSCLLSIWERKITQCDRFSGKKTPFEVLLWMKLRGFQIELSDSTVQKCWNQNPFEFQANVGKTKYCLEYVGFDVRQYLIASQVMKEYWRLKNNETQKEQRTTTTTRNLSQEIKHQNQPNWRRLSLSQRCRKQKYRKSSFPCCPFHSCLCETANVKFDSTWIASQVDLKHDSTNDKKQDAMKISPQSQSMFRFARLPHKNNSSKNHPPNQLQQTTFQTLGNPKIFLSQALSFKH